ncbi:hypothetical protein ALC62_06999, partial [Cyphomyrmex costatus]
KLNVSSRRAVFSEGGYPPPEIPAVLLDLRHRG